MTDRPPASDHWDARYRHHDGPETVSDLLVEHMARLPHTGRAVDLAGGSGRNALWLAQRGLRTTLVDISTVALDIAVRRAALAGVEIEPVARDLEAEGPPEGSWEVIVMTNFWDPAVLVAAATRLSPGGVLVFGQPTERNLERHERPGRRHLPADGEVAGLAASMADVDVVVCDEAWRPNGRHEVHLVLHRPA